jgi:hypothetical protein
VKGVLQARTREVAFAEGALAGVNLNTYGCGHWNFDAVLVVAINVSKQSLKNVTGWCDTDGAELQRSLQTMWRKPLP